MDWAIKRDKPLLQILWLATPLADSICVQEPCVANNKYTHDCFIIQFSQKIKALEYVKGRLIHKPEKVQHQ